MSSDELIAHAQAVLNPIAMATNVILGRQESARLRDVLPFNAWPNPLD